MNVPDTREGKIVIRLPSALYPFVADELDQFEYAQFTLTNVFRRITPDQRTQVVDMWMRNGALHSSSAAWDRTGQVCYLLTETMSGKLIGVNTLYAEPLRENGPVYYKNRMFIDPGYRNSRLMITGTAAMLCFAKLGLSGEGVPGVVNINENRKLAAPGMKRIFSRLGYRLLGEQTGQDVWLFDFRNIEFR